MDLNKLKIIISIEDLCLWLRDLHDDDLEMWLINVLFYNDFTPFISFGLSEDVVINFKYLLNNLNGTKDNYDSFLIKIKKIITKRIKEFDINNEILYRSNLQDRIDFFYNLLNMVYELNIVETFDYLIHHLKTKKYINLKTRYNKDIVIMIFKILYKFPYIKYQKVELLNIAHDYLFIEKYTYLAYKRSYLIDQENGAKLITDLIKAFKTSDQRTKIISIINEYVNLSENAISDIFKILNQSREISQLTSNEKKVLFEILSDSDFYKKLSESNNLLFLRLLGKYNIFYSIYEFTIKTLEI